MTDEGECVEQMVSRHTRNARGLTAVAALAALSATGLYISAGPSMLTNAGAAVALLAAVGAMLIGNRRDGYKARLGSAPANLSDVSEDRPTLGVTSKRFEVAPSAPQNGETENTVRGARTAAEETAARASAAAGAQRSRTRGQLQLAADVASTVATRENSVSTARREAIIDTVRDGSVIAEEVACRVTTAMEKNRAQARKNIQRSASEANLLAEAATAQLRDQRASSALDDAQTELNRSRGYLTHDVEESRARLDAACVYLDDATSLTTAADAPATENVDRIERYREQVDTMVKRCREQEAEEAVREALESVEDGAEAFREGETQAAVDYATTARERIVSLPSVVDDRSVKKCRSELEMLERGLARYSLSEFITNAESTVDEGEGARKAGNATEAIEVYRRALGIYDTALAEAEGEALPETTEIERRMDAIEAAVVKTRADWVDSRSTRLDRELRAGARAVSTGISAADRSDEDTAEEAYETAERAVQAANSLLAGEESSLSLPEETQTEYRSATDSLTGHLGHLRTRINESESPEAFADATALAEYYDALYTLHRTIPEESHPLWREAVSTVLFGGRGIASDAVHYGEQQANRNEASIQGLREERGDGERIKEFEFIETASLRPDDRQYGEFLLPVIPGSDEVLPVSVSADDVLDAIELLAGLPAYPAADEPGGEADALLNIAYFREAFETGPSSDSDEQADEPDAPAVSDTLDELQRELESMIHETE